MVVIADAIDLFFYASVFSSKVLTVMLGGGRGGGGKSVNI